MHHVPEPHLHMVNCSAWRIVKVRIESVYALEILLFCLGMQFFFHKQSRRFDFGILGQIHCPNILHSARRFLLGLETLLLRYLMLTGLKPFTDPSLIYWLGSRK